MIDKHPILLDALYHLQGCFWLCEYVTMEEWIYHRVGDGTVICMRVSETRITSSAADTVARIPSQIKYLGLFARTSLALWVTPVCWYVEKFVGSAASQFSTRSLNKGAHINLWWKISVVLMSGGFTGKQRDFQILKCWILTGKVKTQSGVQNYQRVTARDKIMWELSWWCFYLETLLNWWLQFNWLIFQMMANHFIEFSLAECLNLENTQGNLTVFYSFF